MKSDALSLAKHQQQGYVDVLMEHYAGLGAPLNAFEYRFLLQMAKELKLPSAQFGIEVITSYRIAVNKEKSIQPINKKFRLIV